MNNLHEVGLIALFCLALVYETVSLVRQCSTNKTVDVTRQLNCKNNHSQYALSACTENASLNFTAGSPAEFLFITNSYGNPVLTLVNILICMVAIKAAFKLKSYVLSTNQWMALKAILILICIKLFIGMFSAMYTKNWYEGNPLLNQTEYHIKADYLDLDPLTFLVLLFFIRMLSNFINAQITKSLQTTADSLMHV